MFQGNLEKSYLKAEHTFLKDSLFKTMKYLFRTYTEE